MVLISKGIWDFYLFLCSSSMPASDIFTTTSSHKFITFSGYFCLIFIFCYSVQNTYQCWFWIWCSKLVVLPFLALFRYPQIRHQAFRLSSACRNIIQAKDLQLIVYFKITPWSGSSLNISHYWSILGYSFIFFFFLCSSYTMEFLPSKCL